MQKSLALAMITSEKDVKMAKEAIKSVIDYVDEVCLTIADKEHKTKEVKIGETTIKTSFFKWNDNFSNARNYNFKQVKSDWILWLDSDDVLKGAEKLKELIDYAEDNNVSNYFFQYQYNANKDGYVTEKHWKCQLLKNDGHFEWKGAIHEDTIFLRAVKSIRTELVVRVHRSNEKRSAEAMKRNLRILLKEKKKNPKEPRTKFYLGRTYMGLKEYDKAVNSLYEYLDLSGWDDERYEARLLIGQALMASNLLDSAIKVYNDAILEKEIYPDAYIQKGMCYMKKGDYQKAIVNFNLAQSLPIPQTATYINPLNYTHDIWLSLAVCYLNTAKLKEAEYSVNQSLKYYPQSKQANELKEIIKEIKLKQDTSNRYFLISKYLKDNGLETNIPILLASVPSMLADDPKILALKRTYLPKKKWKKNSIAIFCGNTAEAWLPGDENNKGIGGSETAIIEITKRLAKKGWEIVVYNRCEAPPEGIVKNGVLFKNYWEFNPDDEFDVLWIWRNVAIFDYNLKTRFTLLDLHDVMNPLDFTEERLKKIDKIFVKSKYHRSLLPEIPDEKFEIIGNGISLERFNKNIEKKPNKFIYSSTPNRGLDIILEYMWDDIKKEIPDAELHIFYGWNTFYELEKHNPERMRWMKKVQKLMEKDGVINHGRVGQNKLAEHILESSIWLYPTYFPEIHCITACEMQAGGAIPITSGYAALAETAKNGIIVEGDVYDPEYHKRFVKKVIEIYKQDNKDYILKLKQEAKKFSWDKVANQWHKKIWISK